MFFSLIVSIQPITARGGLQEVIKIKGGVTVANIKYVGLVSRSYIDARLEHGWDMEVAENETEEQLASRMAQHYDTVKIYSVPTRVRGFYRLVALGKNKKKY